MLFLLIVAILGYQVIIGLELGNRSSLIDSHRISKKIICSAHLLPDILQHYFYL